MPTTNTPTEPDHVIQLRQLNACDAAVEWASTQPSAAAAWASCERIDWMTWLLRTAAAYATADDAATAAAYATADDAAYRAAWSRARQEHVRGLCDLLRSAVPCPL